MQISKKRTDIGNPKITELENKIQELESKLSTMQFKIDNQLMTKVEVQSEMLKKESIIEKEVL